MTFPGHRRVKAPLPKSAAASASRPRGRPRKPRSASPDKSLATPALPHVVNPPFSKNLRWTAVTVVQSLTNVTPPLRPCAQVTDEVAVAALRDMRQKYPHRDLHAVERNARRRVYDALKVMTAVGSIQRRGKSLKWMGVQHLVGDVHALKNTVMNKRLVILRKRDRLQAILQRVVAFRQNVERRTLDNDTPTIHKKLRFPFILLKGVKPSIVRSSDRKRLNLNMKQSFHLFSETDVVTMLKNNSSAMQNLLINPHPDLNLICNTQPISDQSPNSHSSPNDTPKEQNENNFIMMRLRDHSQVQAETISYRDGRNFHIHLDSHLNNVSTLPSESELKSKNQGHQVKGNHHKENKSLSWINSSSSSPSKESLIVENYKEVLSCRENTQERPDRPRMSVDRDSIWAAIVDEVAGKCTPENLNSEKKSLSVSLQQPNIEKCTSRSDPQYLYISSGSDHQHTNLPQRNMQDGIQQEHQRSTQKSGEEQNDPQDHTDMIDLMCYENLEWDSLRNVTAQPQPGLLSSETPAFSFTPLGSNGAEIDNDKEALGVETVKEEESFNVEFPADDVIMDLDLDLNFDDRLGNPET